MSLLGIPTHELGGQGGAVVEGDFERTPFVDDVKVGHDVPALVPNESGSRTRFDFGSLARPHVAPKLLVSHEDDRGRERLKDLHAVLLVFTASPRAHGPHAGHRARSRSLIAHGQRFDSSCRLGKRRVVGLLTGGQGQREQQREEEAAFAHRESVHEISLAWSRKSAAAGKKEGDRNRWHFHERREDGLCILAAMGGRDHSQSDEDFAADIHDFRELLRTRDQEGLVSALESPELYRLACDDDRYMGIAMKGVSALAWDAPAQASEHLVHFDVHRSREQKDSAARQAARALLAALEWRQLAAQTTLPMAQMEPLREFLQLQPALSDDPLHGASLRADMRANPQRYLDFFELLDKYGQGLPEWIANLSTPSPPPELPIDALSEDRVSAMSVAVVELKETLARGPGRYIVGAAVLGTLVALPNAVGILIALVLLAGFFAIGERKSYEEIVRPRLVKLAIEHGVGAKPVVSWIYKLRRNAGRVAQFDIKIENNRALDLLAAVAHTAGPGAAPGAG